MPAHSRGAVMGLVNALGNTGGYFGPFIAGWLKETSGSLNLPFEALGVGILVAAALSCFLPKAKPISTAAVGAPISLGRAT
jgi:nitrate/nitrite transporter NarK